MTDAIAMSRIQIWSKSLIPLFLLAAIFALGLSILALRGRDPADSTILFWRLTFGLMLVYWVRIDAKARRYSAPFDFDSFVFFAWPAFVPYYLYQTRGRRGLLLSAGILGLNIAPSFVAALIRITSRL